MSPPSSDRDPIDKLAEEFTERYRRGERPSLSDYAARYPELANDIHELFPALLEMEQLGTVDGAPVEQSPPGGASAAPPRQLGEYRILREIGRGGMGVVYEAVQEPLGRHVALKVLPLHSLLNPIQLERFRREARAAARLHHTNIVPVFGVGEDTGIHYYAMQFIQGQGLDKVLDDVRRLRGRPPERFLVPDQTLSECAARGLLSGQFAGAAPEAASGVTRPSDVATRERPPMTSLTETQYFRSVAQAGLQAAEALAYAHKQRVLHRDIKPSNLLLDTQGTVWVTDFGLAKAADSDDLTHTGDLVGTLRYMAPERLEGQCDVRSEVYGVGITLYEMVTLRPAFAVADRVALLDQLRHGVPARPCRCDPHIPRDLETIILKAMARDPAERYATAEALADDLCRFLADRPIRARRTALTEQVWRWCRRNPVMAILLGTVLLLLSTLASGGMVMSLQLDNALGQARHERDNAQQAEREGKFRLWESFLAEARARRMSRQPGQRFDALRAIQEALKLPLPPGRSLAELRTEAIAALLLPDLEVAREWDGWPDASSCFAIDDAFQRYARGDKDGNVTVRRVADDEELFPLPGDGLVDDYGGLQFSPDGQYLRVRCRTGHLTVWKLVGQQAVIMLRGADLTFAFHPDSSQGAAGFPDGSIRFYDLDSGRDVRRIASGWKTTCSLCWNPKLPRLAANTGNAWRVLDVNTGKVLAEAAVPGGVSAWLDWHPDGRLLAVSTNDRKIHVWDTATHQRALLPLEEHKQFGVIARFNRTGDRLISNDWNRMWRLWDIHTGRQLLTQPADGAYLHFGRDDGLLAAGLTAPKVQLFRFRAGQEFRTLVRRHTDGTTEMGGTQSLVAAGRLLAVHGEAGIALVDRVRHEERTLLPIPGNAPLCFDSDGKALWTYGRGGLLRWPIAADPADAAQSLVGPPERIAEISTKGGRWGSSADLSVAAIPNFNGGAWLWRRGSQRTLSLAPQQDVRDCAVSPDGRWVATGSHGRRDGAGAKVWDGLSGQHVADLPVAGLCCVGFSPDGRWLLTTGGGFRLWEVGRWREGPALGGPRWPSAFAFAADGKLLALEDAPPIVRLVAPDTGKEVARLTAPEQTRLAPHCFTAEGGELVTVGVESSQIHIFDLRAIRLGLQELGLDWDAPGYGEPSKTAPVPAAIRVVGAELVDPQKMAQYQREQALCDLYGNPFDGEAHFRLGMAMLETGRLRPAYAHLTAALAFRPDLDDAYYQRAEAGIRLKRWADAAADASRYLERHPDDNDVLLLRAHTFRMARRYDEAIRDYTAAITRLPREPLLYDLRASCHDALGQLDQANADRQEAEKLSPQDPKTRNNRAAHYQVAAQTQIAAGRFDEAATLLNQALAVREALVRAEPKNATYQEGLLSSYLARGDLHARAGQAANDEQARRELWQEAVADYTRAAELWPQSVKVWLARGGLFTQLGQFDSAAADFTRASALDPKDPQVFNEFGRMYAAQGQVEKAAAAFVRALQLSPRPPSPWLADRAGIDDALVPCEEVFPRVAQLRPKDYQLWIARARYHAHRGQWPQLADDVAAALKRSSQTPGSWFALALVRLQSGDPEGYRQACREMLERFGDRAGMPVTYNTALACLLLPDAVADFKPVVHVAERAVTGTERYANYRFYVLTRALADYREGQYAHVVDRLSSSPPRPDGDVGDSWAFFCLALAHHRLGQAEQARQELGKGRELLERHWPKLAQGEQFANNTWQEWLVCRFLCREAETLIEGKQAKTTKG
jgi:serine/threonine protein kinase/WD40 repeat protein/tetratricopeptide (TPR) repeat protein